MIKKLNTIKTPNKHSDKVFNYTREWLPAKFKTVKEILNHYKDVRNIAIMISDDDDYVYLHFPADEKDRDIYQIDKTFYNNELDKFK
jgi:hypothetical protein